MYLGKGSDTPFNHRLQPVLGLQVAPQYKFDVPK